MKILLPISLDRWRNPISSLLRECVIANPTIEFHSFSKPTSEEDIQNGKILWKLSHLKKVTLLSIISEKYDLVHTASYSHGNHFASIIAKSRGFGHTKVLNTMNLEVKPDDPSSWKRYKSMLKVVDCFVSVSKAVDECLKMDCPQLLQGIIPNGFDPEFFDPLLVQEEELPAVLKLYGIKNYVLCVAAIEPRKRIEVLVELAKRNPEVNFVLAGASTAHTDPVLMKNIKKLANFILVGSVDRKQLRALFAFAGVFVFPSVREGLPLAVIEALGMGLPVICQPKSSLLELVVENVNGRLIDEKMLEEWSKSIVYYQNMPRDKKIKLSKLIRQDACLKYSWPIIGKLYGCLYNKLIHNQSIKLL